MILRECGYDERTIADALGQKTIEMARLYARGADLTKKMTGVAKKFGREVNRRRTKVSNLSRKVSNLKASTDGRPPKAKQNQRHNGGRTRNLTLDPLIKSQFFIHRRPTPSPAMQCVHQILALFFYHLLILLSPQIATRGRQIPSRRVRMGSAKSGKRVGDGR